MATKFAPETLISNALKELGMSVNLFCAYQTVIGRAALAECLKGSRALAGEEAQTVLAVLKELTNLQDSFPVPIDWNDVRDVRSVLATRRTQEQERLEALPMSRRVQVEQ